MINRIRLCVLTELMGSSDYRDRFVAEYVQLKQRHEKLKVFNTKIKAAKLTRGMDNGVDEPLHDCPARLLLDQQRVMGEYLHLLEVRAVIEDVDLEDAIMYLADKANDPAQKCHYPDEGDNADCCEDTEENSAPELPEGILSLGDTVELFDKCRTNDSGTSFCNECPISDKGCGVVLDESVFYHLKQYAGLE